MQVVIKNASLERFLSEVADAFCSEWPAYAEEVTKFVQEEQSRLIKQTGMSQDGTLMTLGHMPAEIYSFVKRQAFKRLNIEDFWADYDNYRLFFKVWTNCAVRRKRTPMLQVRSDLSACPASP